MYPAPPAPAFPSDACTTTRELLRYEDIAQDGRLTPIALPSRLRGLWQHVLEGHPGARNAMGQGVVPILTRLVLATTDARIRVDRPVETAIGFALARDAGEGEPTRLYMNCWGDVRGVAGRSGPGAAAAAGAVELALAGRIFAEHTFTRLFAPPDQRRVTRLTADGFPAVPALQYAAADPKATGAVPATARALGELTEDATTVTFGLDHTDGNQHVNSLVYIRLFLDAAYRRMATLGAPLTCGARLVEIAYRKPCFAGESVRVHATAFEHADGLGAAGVVVGATDGKPRCYVRAFLTA